MTEAKRKNIISVLIAEPTRAQACKRLGITERTLYNYMQDEAFIKEYQSAIDGIVKDTAAKTKEAGLKAINHLTAVIEDASADEVTRIRAAKVILEHLAKMTENESKFW